MLLLKAWSYICSTASIPLVSQDAVQTYCSRHTTVSS